MENFLFALFLALLAGLSTTVGCLIAFLVKTPSPRFLSIVMGFSAGVMLLISFVELLQDGIESLGFFFGMFFFFLGLFLMFLVDVLISHQYEFEDTIELLYKPNGTCEYYEHSKENPNRESMEAVYYRHKHRGKSNPDLSLQKTSIFVFFGVFIHNLPEGMATFISTITEIELGILLAIAIAFHNIPEGIAVSVPIYVCTGSRSKAFFWSFLSGISEFLGALLVGLILFPFINEFLLAAMLSVVAGLMVYISLDELLPLAHSLGREHYSILGILLGFIVMFISLLIL
ncbi:MAG: Zinc transporter ZupT [Promethearchaeota archaeon]|nr:MAG: Zinc transporter ZupT [Candidatus Lokiarchaeota archaeon]